jgi:hypothetical protein
MMSTPTGMALVKNSGEIVQVSIGRRESQPCVAFGERRRGYLSLNRERR